MLHYSPMNTYKGSCHCGAVTYTVNADIENAIDCNCSHCSRKGMLLSFIPGEEFTLLSGEENLTDYLFNKKYIHHLFCKTCGVQSFARSMNSEGKETIALNVRTLHDFDLEALTLIKADGKHS